MGSVIFVVDREQKVRQLAQECLETAGYSVYTFSDSAALWEVMRGPCAYVALVIIGSSTDRSGLIAQQNSGLRNFGRIPFIVLLDDAAEERRINALESGADDCILKPFHPRELVVRVQAVLRRAAVPVPPESSAPPDLLIDTWAMKLLVRGAEISTTTLEFRLIEYLARHRGLVFSRDSLLDAVWGDMQFITPRSVDACIRRIRGKIELDVARPKLLKTVRGVGYLLDAAVDWQSTPQTDCNCAACRMRFSASRYSSASSFRKHQPTSMPRNNKLTRRAKRDLSLTSTAATKPYQEESKIPGP